MRRLGLVLLLAACETPPSKYIPPPEPREVPNVDPPPGIPIMPTASSSAKAPPGGSASAPPINAPTCKTHTDCVIATYTSCCTVGEPRAALRSEIDTMEKDCKDERSKCIDVEVKGDASRAGDYLARCVNKSCTRVEKKKPKKK